MLAADDGRRSPIAGLASTALDLPGFGRADRLDRVEPILPQLDRFLAAAVRDAHERSGGRDVIICGNSLGGCAAMRAAQDPELPIAGIVPVAPAGPRHGALDHA